MRIAAIFSLLCIALHASAAELESRVLTHYVPQDTLETAVRTEGWTEIALNIKGGVRKGDVIRIWAGGSIDRGNGDQPGEHINGPDGSDPDKDRLHQQLHQHIRFVKVLESALDSAETQLATARVSDNPLAEIKQRDIKFWKDHIQMVQKELKQHRADIQVLSSKTRDIIDPKKLSLSPQKDHAFALLVKTETSGFERCRTPGHPLEIRLTKDKEKFWLGFNDEKGRYQDNHLGKGRRHELDPLWVRIEVVRTIVD